MLFMSPTFKIHIQDKEECNPKIATIAIIDLETCNLPAYNNNRTSITELCVYAFDANELRVMETEIKLPNSEDYAERITPELPKMPRILHKLNLLFNPLMMVHPESEQLTGLSNYTLEHESPLDENAAATIVGFLQHLRKPICLVAHNGWSFDFPIVKQALNKRNYKLPEDTLCVDSLRAFLEIDAKRQHENVTNKQSVDETPTKLLDTITVDSDTDEDEEKIVSTKKEIDWRLLNETTPKRTKISRETAALKRKQLSENSINVTPTSEATTDAAIIVESPAEKRLKTLKSRRSLFNGMACAQRKRFPPKNVYRLAPMYTRIFQVPSLAAHAAEADVDMLTRLVLLYGIDFLAFAESQSIPFAAVKALGEK